MPMLTIEAAAQRLNQGELVAFPTETVYGLGADAENSGALVKIFQIKQRPSNHPLIVHLAPEADITYWVKQLPVEARQLIEAFWPGPLTLILARADHIPDTVAGGQASIGIRCPAHPTAQALLRAFVAQRKNGHGGVAAPSANKFGQVSPTQAQHVMDEFGAELAAGALALLAGDASQVGIESTIVDLSRLSQGVPATLLRPGHISRQAIAEVLGYEPLGKDAQAPRASGTLKAHYAPKTPLRWLPDDPQLIQRFINTLAGGLPVASPMVSFKASADARTMPGDISEEAKPQWAILIFEPSQYQANSAVDLIAVPRDPAAYAQQLYHRLRKLDQGGYAGIAVQPLPTDARWEAINDRLQRAAAAFE